MTVGSDGRQGIFDFERVLRNKKKPRTPNTPVVPHEKVQELSGVIRAFGFKQKDIAERCHVSPSFISRVACGEYVLSVDDYERIRRALMEMVYETALKTIRETK